ncbi:MAG: hypothetical protein NTW94_04115 [Legionellales bacterium]|nr:hypothetical protein [Legionellales bacterium]
MLKKIGFPLLCAGSLFATSAFSITEHVFTQGLSVEYEFAPNDPQVFSNIFFWEVKANCTVISNEPVTPFSATMLRKSGSLNYSPLVAGDTLVISVQPGDTFHITAESGAKVELTNLGNDLIKANCATG